MIRQGWTDRGLTGHVRAIGVYLWNSRKPLKSFKYIDMIALGTVWKKADVNRPVRRPLQSFREEMMSLYAKT